MPARVLMRFIGRVVFHRVLTTSTPIGRRARPKMVSSGEPLLRVKPKDLAEARRGANHPKHSELDPAPQHT
jgi:putative flavoprotein involved in K+ transport